VTLSRGRLLLGGLLLAAGALGLADVAGWVDGWELLGRWWPLAVVALGIARFFGRPRDVGGALAVSGAGLVLLAWQLDLVGAALLPIALIGAGLLVLFRTPHAERTEVAATGGLDLVAVFGSRDARVGAMPFDGGRAVAAFGGIELDLRDAVLPAEGASLELVSAFADLEVTVPMGWAVEVEGPVVLGDLDDRTLGAPAGAPTLRIRATVVLGDIELRTDAATRARPAPVEPDAPPALPAT
jgi:hypothetical protein